MLQIDKVAHFGLGGMITACMALVSILQEDLSTSGILLCPIIGHVCVFILSLMKEYIVDDETNWKDILAAMLGSAIAHVVVGVGVLFGLLGNS